jgi:hypothetical protein
MYTIFSYWLPKQEKQVFLPPLSVTGQECFLNHKKYFYFKTSYATSSC